MNLFPDNWFAEVTRYIEPNDFTIVGSISQLKRIKSQENLILYNWDMYSWQDYSAGDWQIFGDLSRKAVDLWFPSVGTLRQSEKIYGTDKGAVIKMFVPLDWLPEPTAGDYVLLPMRYYTKDRCFDWAEKACAELGVKLYHPNHDLSLKEYKKLIAGAGLILSPYAEASTGGMGLIEGTALGKPCLINASPLNGGFEYMGEHGNYFTTFAELKSEITRLLGTKVDGEWVREEYSVRRMARDINERLCFLKST